MDDDECPQCEGHGYLWTGGTCPVCEGSGCLLTEGDGGDLDEQELSKAFAYFGIDEDEE